VDIAAGSLLRIAAGGIVGEFNGESDHSRATSPPARRCSANWSRCSRASRKKYAVSVVLEVLSGSARQA
jgi:hypothetical protein